MRGRSGYLGDRVCPRQSPHTGFPCKKSDRMCLTFWKVSMAAGSAVTGLDLEERATRKIRARIIPFLFVLFVINYIDRVNIGFAALTMNKELALTSQQYGFIAGVFFLGYFMFEVPSNLLLHGLGARVWIARILISWGIVAVLTGFVKTAFQLSALRFLLGVAEAGYWPGIALYLTYWFRHRHLAQATALIAMGNPIASLLGAPISGWILDHVHWIGLSSWRWLLILEGIPAVLAGIFTYFFLPNRPADAKFLKPHERDCILAELRQEESEKLSMHQVTARQSLTNRQVWYLISLYFPYLLSMYTVVFWMPQLIKAASGQYSNTTVGALVTLPYMAAILTMITVARSSDRSVERRYHAALPEIVAAIALFLISTIVAPSLWLLIVLWCFVAMGIFSFVGPFWSLPCTFLAGSSAAVGIALINSVGNIGGFVGPYAMGAINRRTGSFRGGLVLAGISLLLSAILLFMSPKLLKHTARSKVAA
jgi:MFS transporter, ACS family, tartrate transporter